jgi:outer membrane lipoprotein carrier protein LolA
MRAGWLVLCLVCASAMAATPVVVPGGDVFAHPATPTQLAALTRAPAASLDKAQVVRGRFVQKRHLAGLAQPLESTGAFLFARGVGIEWHTEQPFDSQFLLTDAGITQRDEGGVSLQISATEQPALTVVSRVFFALFALDLDSLAHDFDLSGIRVGNAGWEIGLRPRADALRSVFRQAIVSGAASVRSVTLEDGNGDSSEIELSDVTYDPKALTADERRRF